MQLVDVLTINEELKNKEDLLEIVWEAFDYFPEGVWESIKHLGNVTVKHDLKIKSREKVYGAFVFDNLMSKVREMKYILKNENLLLAVTHDPVIAIYHRFELARFKRIVNFVRDYVSKEVGFVSLFEVEDEAAAKVATHGLGHNQDLKHHAKPIDLMYARLLNGSLIKKDGFCDECQRKLKNRIRVYYSNETKN